MLSVLLGMLKTQYERKAKLGQLVLSDQRNIFHGALKDTKIYTSIFAYKTQSTLSSILSQGHFLDDFRGYRCQRLVLEFLEYNLYLPFPSFYVPYSSIYSPLWQFKLLK